MRTIFRMGPAQIFLFHLPVSTTPAEILAVANRFDTVEHHMQSTGLFTVEQMRPVNEMRMQARAKLGRALAAQERAPGHQDEGKRFPRSGNLLWRSRPSASTRAA